MKKVVVMSALAVALSANGDSVFDGLYFGAGAMFGFGEDTAKIEATGSDVSKNINRFLGSLFLGSGKAMNSAPLYFGGEIIVDLSKAKKETFTLNNQNMTITNNGVIPSFGLRLGYTKPDMDMLFFAKFSLTRVKSSLDYTGGKLSVGKFAPTIAFGIEKSICRKYTTRFDIEYVFKKEKKNDTYKLERGGSLNLRVMFAYNVRF